MKTVITGNQVLRHFGGIEDGMKQQKDAFKRLRKAENMQAAYPVIIELQCGAEQISAICNQWQAQIEKSEASGQLPGIERMGEEAE